MTDTPGWTPPTDPGAPGTSGTPGDGTGRQAPPPAAPPPGPPSGPPPGAPPGWGAPVPGAPYGYGPPGSFGAQPGYGAQAGYGGYGAQPGHGGYGAPPPGHGSQPGYGAQAGYGPQPGYGAPAGWGRAAAPEPGIVPIRPLGLGEILDGAFAIVRQYPRVTLGLSAIVVTITQLVSFLTQLPAALDEGYVDPDTFGGVTFEQIASWLLSMVGMLLLAGLLTPVVGDAVLGKRTTMGAAWARVRPRFPALLGASVLGAVVPTLGLVLCVLPGAFLWGAWAFLTPVVALERTGVTESVRRSWRLAVPDFWRVWGIRALATIIAGVINAIVVMPIALVAVGATFLSGTPDITLLPLTIITLGGIVAGTVTAPFSSGVLALLYIDRRMRAEGLDVTLARAAQAGTS